MTANTLDMDFEETLASLLKMIGSRVEVHLTDANSLLLGAVFGGVLGRGQDIMRDLGPDAIVFNIDGGGFPATFTITSKDFEGARWDGPRGLYVRAGGVQFWIAPEAVGRPPWSRHNQLR
jgi:hypothetical protein